MAYPKLCSVCGNILDVSGQLIIKCDCCGEENQSIYFFLIKFIGSKSDTALGKITTTSSTNFPSLLRTKLTSETQSLTAADYKNTKRIQRECPDCQAKEMTWSEAQLRGAGEGSTIFYRCSCGHRYSLTSILLNYVCVDAFYRSQEAN